VSEHPGVVQAHKEVEARVDDPRVIASIDDGRFLSALSPLSSGFIMDPDEKFIGE